MPLDDVQREQLQEFQLVAASILAHPRLRELVEALVDDPDENLTTVKADPKKYFSARGIELPKNATVRVSRNTPITISICVGSVDFWCVDITLPDITIVHTVPS